MKCPACGTVNSPSYKLCSACNTPLKSAVPELPSAEPGRPAPPRPVQVVQSYWQVAGGAYATGSTPWTQQTKRVILVLTARGKLVGLSRDTGELIWWNQLTHQDHGITDLAITEDTIFATTSTQMLFCIDYHTGATRWTAPTTSARAKILVDGSYVFVVHSDDVNCFNIHGYRLWSQKLPGMGMARLGIGLPGNVRLSDPPT